jgi:predicted O-methyltransferase YrrM
MIINFHQIRHFILHFFLAKRKGHGVHSPFVYRLCEEVFYNNSDFYCFSELRSLRKQLLMNEQVLLVEDYGAGSMTFRSNERKIKDIVARGTSSMAQSEMLYRLVNLLGCRVCIELGTSAGLNTLYLAAANKKGQIITIEGSRSLSQFASSLAQRKGFRNITYINALFDVSLPDTLAKTAPPDLVYVDGNHTYSATMRYFRLLLEKKHKDTVLVFDDIYWSAGMTMAWKEICEHPEVTLCIDTFYSGIVFFKKEFREKTQLRLYLQKHKNT